MALHKLQDEAYKVRMTPAEKSAMRARIFGAPTAAPAPSPYYFFSFQFVSTRVLAPLAVVFLIGSGTTYAAEGALPGDTLYPVKIYVNEEVAQVLSRTSRAKAEVHTELAERRLTEAQELAAAGRLDASTSETLATNLEAHVAAAEAEADKAEEAEMGKGNEVRAKLAAALDTNARVLVRIGVTKDQATKENTEVFAGRLIARADRNAAANTRIAAKVAPAADASMQTMALSVAQESATTGATTTEDPAGQKVAASLEHEAADALSDAREQFDAVKKSLGTSTIDQVEKEFSSIETSMSLGSASLGAGAYAQAESDFMDALRRAVTLEKILAAHKKFNGGLILPLLGGGDYDEHDHEEGEDDAHTGEVQVEVEVNGSLPIKVIQ